jgi:hypothetical protein
LALKLDGRVVAWGFNGQGRTDVPAALTNAIAIAAGSTHSLALKADGTVVAWGDELGGRTAVPLGLKNVVAISASFNHSLALALDPPPFFWPPLWPESSSDTEGLSVQHLDSRFWPLRYTRWEKNGLGLVGATNSS